MTKARILVVDDDPDIRIMLSTVLQAEGYGVITAKDGVECLELVREMRPDLLILDLLMPRKDGFAVVRELREDAEYAALPILILTAVPEEASRRRYELEVGVAMDVQDYVVKRIRPPELLRRVEKLLKASGR
ncbi:MAG: response regulator [Anaerolineae bacterium]|nr:response regulator [Anaerolineae bacterium]